MRSLCAVVLSALAGLLVQQEDRIQELGEKLLEEAKAAYEDARTKSSVPAFVDAGFKLEEARIKFIVLQEIGSPEKQKLAGERLRAINQLGKLIHDGKVAVNGTPADAPPPAPAPDAPATPATPAPAARPAPAEPLAVAPTDVTKRLPVPEAAKQKEAEKTIKDLYKDQYAKKSPADRKALAALLLKEAPRTKDDPAALWVLCREAQDLATQACDVPTAIGAIETAAQFFDVDTLGLKNSSLSAAAKSAKVPDEFLALVEALLRLITDLVTADQYDAADKTAALALQCARRANDPALVARCTNRSKEITEAKTLFQAMKSVLQTQAKNPDDPNANLEIGRFLCFVKGTWDLGLRFMSKGSDPVLKPLAEKELGSFAQPGELVGVADGWFDLAEKEKSPLRKSQLQAHARVLYEAALPSATALVRVKIEKRLEALTPVALPGMPGPAVDLLKLIDVKRPGVLGDWTCDGSSLVCTRPVQFNNVPIPYEPPEEYDLTIIVDRKEGADALYIGLAKGPVQFYCSVDDWGTTLTALGFVDGKNPKDNETKVMGKLLTNLKPSTIVCSVRKTEVTVTVDGKRILAYKGGYDRLTNMVELSIPNKRALFIGSAQCRYSITRISLTPITGQGKIAK
jgi:hypothetical protein